MKQYRLLLVLVSALICGTARADLGTALASGLTHASATGSVQTRSDGVRLQTFRSSDGNVQITEYASASGTVFGLAWRGTRPPELGAWLGQSRAASLQNATPQGGLHAAGVSGQDVELRMSNTPRGFGGMAWAPSLTPTGFDTDDLQP